MPCQQSPPSPSPSPISSIAMKLTQPARCRSTAGPSLGLDRKGFSLYSRRDDGCGRGKWGGLANGILLSTEPQTPGADMETLNVLYGSLPPPQPTCPNCVRVSPVRGWTPLVEEKEGFDFVAQAGKMGPCAFILESPSSLLQRL